MRRRLTLALAAALSMALVAAAAGPRAGWRYVEVDDSRSKWGDFEEPEWLRYFGLGAADLDADGDLDRVSGRYAYRNPGGT